MKENFGGFEYDWHANRFLDTVSSSITLKKGLQAKKKYLVILRDPISRWITGFAQAFWGWDPTHPNYYANLLPDLWFKQIHFDDHTRRQIDFLQGLDHESTTWFDCSQNLVQNVRDWMKGRFDHEIRDLDDDQDNGYNVAARGRQWPTNGITQQQIIDRVKTVIDQNPSYIQRLREFYQPDFDLRSRVEFYGSR